MTNILYIYANKNYSELAVGPKLIDPSAGCPTLMSDDNRTDPEIDVANLIVNAD